MLEKEVQDFLEKLRTRREFLKLSGKGLATLTVTASILNLLGVDSADAAVTVTPKGIIIASRNRCVGCQKCETVCTIKNNGKSHPFIARVKVGRNFNYGKEMKANYRYADGEFGNFLMTQDTCRQCKNPNCMAACPMKAISYNEKYGTWAVDKDKCIGCGTCTQVCPVHMPTVDPETRKSSKCILCGTCAEHCPTGALKVMPWQEVSAILNRYGYSFS